LQQVLNSWCSDQFGVTVKEYSREVKQGYDSLMKISGVGLAQAEALFKAGFASLADISDADTEDIISVIDMDEPAAEAMIEEAKNLLEEELQARDQESPEDGTQEDES
jgi:N utilization substance protein A